jgi:hypothetical protein
MAPDDAPYPATVVNLAEARDKIGRTLKDHLENYDLIIPRAMNTARRFPPPRGNAADVMLI